ncbi:hypothetical protein Sjap_025055 [Stephania japonica]|uniref:Uncharacterized protein n=1 Tax=Stephania japonica TaxID=461633 RepID=A0AAP0HF77_9MAGN
MGGNQALGLATSKWARSGDWVSPNPDRPGPGPTLTRSMWAEPGPTRLGWVRSNPIQERDRTVRKRKERERADRDARARSPARVDERAREGEMKLRLDYHKVKIRVLEYKIKRWLDKVEDYGLDEDRQRDYEEIRDMFNR